MDLTGTVWAVLKNSTPADEGVVAETLRPYRGVLTDYARGRGLSAADIETGVRKALRTLSDSSFVSGVDPSKVGFRQLLHALLGQAIKKPRGWTSISEKEEVPILEVASQADDDFNRLWQLHLLRSAFLELPREAPELARSLSLRYQDGLSFEEIGARTGRGAQGDVALGEARLKVLLGKAVHSYTVTADQFAAETKTMAAAPGAGEMHELGRKLFAALSEEGRSGLPSPKLARFRIGITGFASVVLLAAIVVGWTSCELRREREANARERGEEQLVHKADLAVEHAAAFVNQGGDVSRHHQDLQKAIAVLRRLRPASPWLSRGLSLQVGAGADPALFKETMAGIGARPEGVALTWDYWVYRAIRRSAWGEPEGGKPPSEVQGPRVEADLALLAGEDERALDLYTEAQLVRPGDPLVWLAGSLAAYRSGSPSSGARFARRAAELLDVGESEPREGHAVARALEGLCFEKLGREEERTAAFQAAARRARGNSYARALPSRPSPGLPASAPELPRSATHLLVFDALGEPASDVLAAALDLLRLRLRAAGVLGSGDVSWDSDTRRLLVSLGESTAQSARIAEWLIIRRGVFTAHDLAPRELNDQWRYPSKPAGNDWAPINLFYPDLPKSAGRYRLLKQEVPLLSRGGLALKYDAGEGRLVWSCKDLRALPAGAGLALLLDGEIFWYGRVAESRSGFLVVGPADAQTLISFIFEHGPLPVQFARRG
jgi:hypothetical protein